MKIHICVPTTTRQTSERGHDRIVVEDAIGTRNIARSNAEELKKVILNKITDGLGLSFRIASLVHMRGVSCNKGYAFRVNMGGSIAPSSLNMAGDGISRQWGGDIGLLPGSPRHARK